MAVKHKLKPLTVVVAVIRNEQGQVLISQRAKHAHQGGLWEFPGGKIEAAESSQQALRRELLEEVNITIHSSKPLLKIHHHYPDLFVCLDVYSVTNYQGEAVGMEGQAIKWVDISCLGDLEFPEANKAIIKSLMLPRYYPIVDESIGSADQMLSHLMALIEQGYTMIQWRVKSLEPSAYKAVTKKALALSRERQVILFLNTPIEMAVALSAQAVHLSTTTSKNLSAALPENMLYAASCHSSEDIKQMHSLGVLFSVLSPVCRTESHPEAKPLGWSAFASMADKLSMPIFALGGMTLAKLETAVQNNAYGISGIRGFLTNKINE